MKKAFYAYSSQKRDLLEDIRNAVRTINDESSEISITTWEDFSISGKFIIDDILKAINDCDLFMCDLTYLNYNVLYELGYAISKKKRIWISLNSTHPKAKSNYKSFSPLTTVGYAGYRNSAELVRHFYSDVPYAYSDTPTITLKEPNLSKSLLYLKCEVGTSASSGLHTLINSKSQLPVQLDDASEINQPLSWYLELLPSAFGAIIHFHTLDSEHENHNDIAKKALIAGMAKGLRIKTLLLAHEPFQAPLDYHDELKIHSTPAECEAIAKQWLEPIIEQYREMLEEHKGYTSEQSAVGKLSSLIIGDYVAENETQDLTEYFLETAEYNEALTAQQVLFVGRKGTGKTANLIKLRKTMSDDKRNFVVSIQPQGHEFEGVLGIMEHLRNSSENGNFIESIWKFLIFTEIARQYYDYLSNQPLHYVVSDAESKLMDFVKTNERVINADFTLRLENVVGELKEIDKSDTLEQQRSKISEFLHANMLHQLRNLLGSVLTKKGGVKILIDNLDKGWNDSANLSNLSELLFGLLNVINKITSEFQRNTYKHEQVNLSLIVFLRSDIFSRLMSHAPERDKISTKFLSWTDPSLLFRVIEKRIDYSSNGITSPETFWRDYFCETVQGVPLKEYVQKLIIPRPRDIIFLFKMALQEAVNRNHRKVEEIDFASAEFAYSEYAFQSLLPENGKRVRDFESILYEFVGSNAILSQEEVEAYVSISTEEDPNYIVQILCETTFLGQEISVEKFEYYSEKKPAQITNKLAQRHTERTGNSKRYKINSAFHNYLGIIS